MVITRLIGGLGNQMFQYAAGRRLAHMLGVELKLDIYEFENHKLRRYELVDFNIQENIASPEEVRVLTIRKQGIMKRIERKVLHRAAEPPPTYIREKKKFHFDHDILNLSDGVYLYGSWQSEKYFKDIEEIIRKEFTVKHPLADKNLKLAEQIQNCESVSLHVRRGDYVSNPEINRIHGTCSLDYYSSCVKKFIQTLKNPHFFIFSDDPEWTRENLKLSSPMTLVDHNGADKAYEDLRLMSMCKHNIIANSSFSWWGAWLNQNPNRIILAPKPWFNSNVYDSRDLIPNKWFKV